MAYSLSKYFQEVYSQTSHTLYPNLAAKKLIKVLIAILHTNLLHSRSVLVDWSKIILTVTFVTNRFVPVAGGSDSADPLENFDLNFLDP